MIQLPASLGGLARYNKFLICKLVPRKDADGKPTGKTDKVPVNPDGLYPHSPKDPAIWLSADAAIKALNDMGDPQYLLGFWLTKDDPFFFLDIDGAYDAEAGQWNEIATWMVNRFAGAAIEVSQSGTGLHIIGTGICPDHGCKYTPLGLELYTHERFIALGLHDPQGDCNTDHTQALAEVVPLYFSGNAAKDDGEWNDVPVEGSSPIEDDTVLINKALVSKSAAGRFGAKATFEQLWTNDEDALAGFWPSSTDTYDRSNADMALAQHLAFWTGGNHERIERLMKQSGLVRPKWEDRKDYYLPMTIRKAVTAANQFYNKDYRASNLQTDNPTQNQVPKEQRDAPDTGSGHVVIGEGLKIRTGTPLLFLEQQLSYFEGMVFVSSLNKVYVAREGMFYDQSTFKNMHGGQKFAFNAENKVTTDAWKGFLHNELYSAPKVHRVDMDPTHEPGEIYLDQETQHIVCNIYKRPVRPSIAGDPGPFLDLLERQVPNDRDREIMLCWLAALVQNPGVKFRYALLTQGTEGNGKSTVNKILKYCIGKQYCYSPKAVALVKGGGQFNAWMPRTLLAIVEELRMPRGAEAESALKQFITGEEIEVEGKGVDQLMMPLRMNFIFNINDKADVALTANNRRWLPIYTAQQKKEDLARDGLTKEYWIELNDWLYNQDGFAICCHFLENYEVREEWNPVTGDVAPRTSAYEEALEVGLTDEAYEIYEAATHELPGFKGGWVSSMKMRELLLNRGFRSIHGHRVAKMMAELGYVVHSGLPDGKASRLLEEEGGRPRLYVKQGHLSLNEVDPGKITNMYLTAQDYHVKPNGARNFA